MNIEWTDLVPLPPVSPETLQPGVSGLFSGLHGNPLIFAGGQTIYGSSKTIWSLDREDLNSGWKINADLLLPPVKNVIVAIPGKNNFWMLEYKTRGGCDDSPMLRPEGLRYFNHADILTLESALTQGGKIQILTNE